MSRPSLEYRRPLLPEEVDIEDNDPENKRSVQITSSSRRFIVLCAVLVLSVLLNFGQAWRTAGVGSGCGLRPDESYSPAHSAVEYEMRKFSRARFISPFHGPPSDAVDDAWEGLYSFGISRIPKAEAALMLNRTVPIPGDEGKYVVALDVFHQLHCLNMVRQALHPDYYPPMQIERGFDHIDHCVNSLRESLMCSVDITPNTWIWNETLGRSYPRLDNMHTCRNFDRVRDWAKSRTLQTTLNYTVHVEDDLEYTVLY